MVKIYEAVVNKSNFFQKKPVITRQFDIKCSFLVPAHEKQQQKARAHAVCCKNALRAGSSAHARKQNGEMCLTFEFLRTADDEARLKTERFAGQSSPTYTPAQTGRGRPCQ